ncbi:MAG TPA: RraA family protein [Candidatus Binatus sp.]|jgi:4-hydroxy-4-methyl-2-oxoglutarate aldolase|nr:RraA family protein [Candidatus Binatus sp.]
MNPEPLSPELLGEFRKLSTCVVASAIESFDVRLRNTGFANSSIRSMFPEFPPLVGYVATARILTADPPMQGHSYYARPDWWQYIRTIPEPRVVVIQDTDSQPGLGAFVGEIHANILLALGCAGLVTNGAVRDLPAVRATGFQMFAGNVSVSHGYAHVFDFGGSVELGGLEINPGDLIQGDLHGVQTIPREIAARVASVAHDILLKRKALIELCHSKDFTVAKLIETLWNMESNSRKSPNI